MPQSRSAPLGEASWRRSDFLEAATRTQGVGGSPRPVFLSGVPRLGVHPVEGGAPPTALPSCIPLDEGRGFRLYNNRKKTSCRQMGEGIVVWQDLWERHRGAFCVAVGMACFLLAGLLVRALPSVRENLGMSAPAPRSSESASEEMTKRLSKAAERKGVSPAASDLESEWFLYVTGSVRRPGVYRLPPGARTVHLVEAAGGLDGFADPIAVNLAEPLADGMHVHVPRKGERSSQAPLVAVAPTVRARIPGHGEGRLIDVNRASEAELTALRGIGPTLARRIVEYREANGSFQTLEDLVRVREVGAAKLEGFRDQATVGP